MSKKERHILGLSGGKDSTALALLMRDEVPEMEYVFCDTKKELPETYEYLDKVEAYLGKKIVRLNSEADFDHWLEMYGGYLPSSKMRWCTRMLKLRPFERYVGEDPVVNYVGIRADEQRDGYISTKPNIRSVFPFRDKGITKADVTRILEESGVGMPSYYEWRSRSGCFFCFFQRREEWVGLLERHPDLFEEAKRYEKFDPETGQRYTWNARESLDELARPERIEGIKTEADVRKRHQAKAPKRHLPLMRVFAQSAPDDELDEDDKPCLICQL